jgi:mRNA-degrading endonuclease RelE of RelBE toxin-antitoxin system
MYKVIIHRLAEDILIELSERDKKSFYIISQALDEIEKNGLQSSNTKHLSNTNKIFRKRIGRWRILFTIEEKNIHIWIVAIEKDTKKDYKKWIKYIVYNT